MSKLSNATNWGYLELKPKTFARLERYMHRFKFGFYPDALYYCKFAVLKTDSDKNYLVKPDGSRERIKW